MIQNIPAKPVSLRASSSAFRLGRAAERRDYSGNDEPSLDELLADDVMLRVMLRDNVQPEQVLALVGHVTGR